MDLKEMAELIGGRPWGLDKDKPRIYMPSMKGRSICFEFPDWDKEENFGGATLHVWIDDCGQPPAWYVSQKQMEMRRFTKHGLALLAMIDGEPEGLALAGRFMALDGLDDDLIDVLAHHLVNGNIAEATALLP